MRPEELCGLLAEPDRLAVFAAVVLGAGTVAEVAAATGLPTRVVTGAVRRLVAGELVVARAGRLVVEAEAIRAAARAAAGPGSAGEPEPARDPDPGKAAVLRTFIRDGRLVRLPAPWGKRRVVLEHIAASFEPGVKYPERTVDAVLRAWYDDYVTVRRYLIDEELLAREGGVYWRIGGPTPD